MRERREREVGSSFKVIRKRKFACVLESVLLYLAVSSFINFDLLRLTSGAFQWNSFKLALLNKLLIQIDYFCFVFHFS